MTLKSIEKEFSEKFGIVYRQENDYYVTIPEDIKAFYRQKFLKLLEGLKVEEKEQDDIKQYSPDILTPEDYKNTGYNQCTRELNKKIEEASK